MSEDILTQLINCSSTKDIWSTLQNIFAAQSIAQTKQYKNRLQNIKKGLMPLKEYFMKIQQCVDALASVGKPIS